MQEESEAFETFLDSHDDGRTALELHLKEIKLKKLGVSKTKTDTVEESNNLGHSSWWWGCGQQK